MSQSRDGETMRPTEPTSVTEGSRWRFETSERRSWWFSLVSIVLAALAAIIVAQNTSSFDWAMIRLAWLAVLILAGGAIIGSERLVAFSAVPALAGLLLADSGQGEAAWVESLAAGCLWFLAIEAALTSIEGRGGLTPDPSVLTRRVSEVTTVIALATAVGLIALSAGSFAPERSLLARAAVASVVLVVLFAAARRLSADD